MKYYCKLSRIPNLDHLLRYIVKIQNAAILSLKILSAVQFTVEP